MRAQRGTASTAAWWRVAEACRTDFRTAGTGSELPAGIDAPAATLGGRGRVGAPAP